MKKLFILTFLFVALQGFSQITNTSNCDFLITFHGYTASCMKNCTVTICIPANTPNVAFPAFCGDAQALWNHATVCPASGCTTCGIPADECFELGLVNCDPKSTSYSGTVGALCSCTTINASSTPTTINLN